MNNTSHIIQILKDKIERLESRGKNKQFYWIPRHCGVELNERADSEAEQSNINGRDSKLLLPVVDLKSHWKKKSKVELNSFCENTKQGRGQNYFKRYYKNRSSP
jgi:hypothetical protein